MLSSALQANTNDTLGHPAMATPAAVRQWDLRPAADTMRTPSMPAQAASEEDHTAADPRVRRKTRILIDATRHFCELPRARYGDVEQYKELFYQLIGSMPPADRRIISAMLARNAYTPRQVALYLALDKVEIAAPFLLFSPVLSKRDLEKIVQKRGSEHAEVISRRQQDTKAFFEQSNFAELAKQEKTPDPLLAIRRAPEETVTSKSIAAAARSASVSPVQMPEKAPSDIDTGKDLAGAPAKTRTTTAEVMALAGAGGRLGRNRVASTEPASVITPAKKPETVEAPVLIAEDATGECSPARVHELHVFARRNDIAGFASAVEKSGGPEADITTKLLQANSGDEILYLLCALGVPFPQNRQIAMLLIPRYGRSTENYCNMARTLDELDQGICRMIFNEIGARFEISKAAQVEMQEGEAIDVMKASAAPEVAGQRSDLPEFRQAAHERRQRLNKLIGSEPQPKFGKRREAHSPTEFSFGT